MNVSVVILTQNRRELLKLVLASLARQTVLPSQVVVVDNGSSDGTREMLGAVHLPFPILITNGPGASFAEARNVGVAAADGDRVLFLDDDCEADAPLIERLNAAMDRHGWVACGGVPLPANELEAPNNFPPVLNWTVGLMDEGIYGPLAGRRHLPTTSVLMADRSCFMEFPFQGLGGSFGRDPDEYDSGREDAEWWQRIRRAGKRTGIAKRALVWHHVTQDRMNWDYIQDRAISDGRASWTRRRCVDQAREAIRDVVFQPLQVIQRLQREDLPFWEIYHSSAIWARRQVAYVEAAVDDHEGGFSPVHRTGGYVKEAGRLVVSGGKSLARLAVTRLNSDFTQLRPLPDDARPPRRILAVCHDLLGDGVLAMPMLTQLANAYPEAKVDVLCGPVCAPMFLANLPENVCILETTEKERSGWMGAKALYDRLKERSPDVVVMAYCHGLNPAPLFLLDGAPVISFTEDNGFSQSLWGDLVSHPVTKRFWKAEPAALLDLLMPLGIKTEVSRPAIGYGEEAEARVAKLLKAHDVKGSEAFVVHFEADGREKFWPQDRMAEVVKRLVNVGRPVVLVGSRDGRIAAEREGILGLQGCVSFHQLLNSEELAALFAASRLFVGPDSGPAHVAQAAGCRCLLLWGATEVHRWGPMEFVDGEDSAHHETLFGASGDWLVEEMYGLLVGESLRLLGLSVVWGWLEEFHKKEENSRKQDKRH